MAYHIQYHDHAGKELMGSDGGTIYHGKTVGGAAKHARGVMESRKVTHAKNFPHLIPHGFSIRSNEGQEKYSQNPRILHAEGSAKANPSGASFSATDDFSAAHAEFAAVQGDHNVHLRPAKEIKAMSDAEFNKHHDYLEDINMHPHNVILTAKRYGNDKQVARAETLLRRHMKQGHLSSGIAKGRKMLSDSVKKTAGKPLGNHGFSATPDTFSAAHAEFAAVAAPKKAPSHDPAAVRELTLHADNTEKLYNNERYIHAAMMHKHDKGTYNHDLAAKAYKHHADAAAAHYTKEYGTKGPHGSFGVFSSADRAAAARHYADQNHPAQTTAVDDPRRDNRGPQHAVNAFKKKHPENFSATTDTFAAAHGEFAAMDCGGYAALPKSDGPFTHSKVKVLGLGRDTNGNKLVKVGHSGGSFTIQTNGNIPTAHRHTGKVDPESHGKIMDEVHAHVSSYGTDRQKKILGIK